MATNPVTATRTAKSEVRRSRLTANEYVAIHHAAEPLPIWLRLAMDLAVVTGQSVGRFVQNEMVRHKRQPSSH